jgi:betaine-aldehyde dehydrogenase
MGAWFMAVDRASARIDEDPRLPAARTLFYGGQWHQAKSGQWVETINPATGQVLAQVQWAGPEDVDAAISSAETGFAQWRRTDSLTRSRALMAWAARLRDNADQLAWLDASDAGMPVSQVLRDIELAAVAIEFCAGLVTEIKGETFPPGNDQLTYTLRQPLGVVARIVAFNHPLMFAASRAAAPLAAGNSLILKPSEHAPLSALRLAELSEGLFPPGVVNVLPGGQACGEALARSPRVRKISLIGSVATGKAVLRSAAETIKQTALELGGKNALIAYPDTAIDDVADAIFRGMNFAWGGQSCGSTSRAFVHADIHDQVVARVVEKCRSLRPGLPTDKDSAMGCLISLEHRQRVADYVQSALDEGATLETGGRPLPDPALSRGAFFEPTVFSGVTVDMRIAREEIFGPVLSIFSWRDEATMLRDVDGTEFGLTASIWTDSLATALRVAEQLEVGYVWINGVGAHIHGAPFGGVKQSGLGREESIDELLAYTTVKTINIRQGKPVS